MESFQNKLYIVLSIQRHLRFNGKLIGICGGFQMLGKAIHDPQGIEGQAGSTNTLGFLAFETTLEAEKQLINVSGELTLPNQTSVKVKGYEIHAGVSNGPAFQQPLMNLNTHQDGIVSDDHQVFGCYTHGLFDEPDVINQFLLWAGKDNANAFNYKEHQEQELNRLAQEVEQAIPYSTWMTLFKG